MKTRTVLLASILVAVALAGCQSRGHGALRPSIYSIHSENAQNYTLVLKFENIGDSKLRYVDGYISGSTLNGTDGERVSSSEEYYGSNTYARENGEPPRKLFNDTDVVEARQTVLATVVARFDDPLPPTARIYFTVYMTYDPEDGSRWGWTYDLPCLNTRGEPILNPDGRNCELLQYDHIQKPPGTYPWGSP